jgi:DNA-binding response OmpR family regulator
MSDPTIRHGQLTLDVESYKLFVDDRALCLSVQETALLRTLMSAPRHPFSYLRMVEAIGEHAPKSEHAMRSAISRLRQRLRAHGCHEAVLKSIRRSGYVFDMAETSPSARAPAN